MDRLTPNLWAISAFTSTPALLETRQLDFNLARRSALVINRIIGQMWMVINTTSGHGVAMGAVQEMDTDPDNVQVEFGATVDPDDFVRDSSRPFRQVLHHDRDTATGSQSPFHTLMEKDWTNEDEIKRPISITPMRHHFRTEADIAAFAWAELHIDYFIVELSLLELGIINASRR